MITFITQGHDFRDALTAGLQEYKPCSLPIDIVDLEHIPGQPATIVTTSDQKQYYCETWEDNNGVIYMRVTEFV